MAQRKSALLFSETAMPGRRHRAALAIGGIIVTLALARSAAPAAELPEDGRFAERYLAAVTAYDARRFDDARREFESLASEGVAQAEFMLGVMHEYGDGVDASYSDAVRWYEAAAERGLTSAETRLGTLYLDGTGVAPRPPPRTAVARASRAKAGSPRADHTRGPIGARPRCAAKPRGRVRVLSSGQGHREHERPTPPSPTSMRLSRRVGVPRQHDARPQSIGPSSHRRPRTHRRPPARRLLGRRQQRNGCDSLRSRSATTAWVGRHCIFCCRAAGR